MKILEVKIDENASVDVLIEINYYLFKKRKYYHFLNNGQFYDNSLWYLKFSDENGERVSIKESEQITNYMRIHNPEFIDGIIKIARDKNLIS